MLHSLDRPSARVIGRIVDYEDDDDDYDDDTIELELNESAIQALTEAAALALAASEERAEPRLTLEEHAEGSRGLEAETRADGRGATGQGSRTVEQETPGARQVAEAIKQEAPAARQVPQALEQQTPATRHGTVSFVRPPRKRRRFALGFGIAAAVAGLFGGLTYLATAGARHPLPPVVSDSGSRPIAAPAVPASAPTSLPAPATPASPASPAPPDVPIRFKNPFDRSEVFEFPAGTSQAEMRDAVAQLLSQRALERKSLFVKRPRRNTKSADPNASVTAGS